MIRRAEETHGASKAKEDGARGNTRSRILRVTRKLIANQGIHATSLAAIAREAQISRGTLFYYFPSKQSLLFQVMEDSFAAITDRIMQAVESLDPGSGLADREEIFYLTLRLVGESRSLNQINFHLFQQAIADNRPLRESFQGFYRKWRRLIAERLQDLFPAVSRQYNPEALGALVLALIDGVSIQALLEDQPPDYRETARLLVRLFDAGGQGQDEGCGQ